MRIQLLIIIKSAIPPTITPSTDTKPPSNSMSHFNFWIIHTTFETKKFFVHVQSVAYICNESSQSFWNRRHSMADGHLYFWYMIKSYDDWIYSCNRNAIDWFFSFGAAFWFIHGYGFENMNKTYRALWWEGDGSRFVSMVMFWK